MVVFSLPSGGQQEKSNKKKVDVIAACHAQMLLLRNHQSTLFRKNLLRNQLYYQRSVTSPITSRSIYRRPVAANSLQSTLCPAFQCAAWHSRLQYLATWQLLYPDSLPLAAAVARSPRCRSPGARPQWLHTWEHAMRAFS